MLTPQFILDLRHKQIGDLFAGGGGASCAIEQATGLYVDFAVNHDAQAVSMHTVNHPQTRHYQTDVYEVDPYEACGGRPVGLLHLSPDCTHHSQAAGGQPRSNATRSLSWVGKRWAAQVRPDIITLENVKQITRWGRLVAKRDKATGRVVKLDGSIAAPGERVPVQNQFLVPDTKHAGSRWRKFVRELEKLGYVVEWRMLCAADYGAPTTRERLFMVARCDGQPIVWPAPTHHKKPEKGQKKWRAAAECIDWAVPGKSIFNREKPLAEATMRRIAKGITKFVLNNSTPFIVPIEQPVLISPVLVNAAHGEGSGRTKRRGIGSRKITDALGTVTASGSGGHAVAAAYLMQANGGFNTVHGKDATIGGGKTSLAVCELGNAKERALKVAAFLINYYGNGDARDLTAPMDTLTTKDRLALVTVYINEEPYYIVDITLRMLLPKELYKAQGFPDDYVFDRDQADRPLTKTAQVRMCGNSVSPPPMVALIRANYYPEAIRSRACEAA